MPVNPPLVPDGAPLPKLLVKLPLRARVAAGKGLLTLEEPAANEKPPGAGPGCALASSVLIAAPACV